MSNRISFEVKSSSTASNTEIVAVYQDGSKKPVLPKSGFPKTLTKFVERLKKSGAFSAGNRSTQFIRFGGSKGSENVLFVGMGIAKDSSAERARGAGGTACVKLLGEKADKVTIYADSFGENALELAAAFVEGIALRAYNFDKYLSKREDLSLTKVTLVTANKKLAEELGVKLKEISAMIDSVNLVRDFSNEPSNIGTPEYFANQAKKLAREYGVKCTVMSEAQCVKEKMNLFIGVGIGSDREGKVVILEYTPKGVKDAKTLALVGKGITFDTGGISIKPSLRMEEMKHDMTGAATMIGATLLAAKLKVPTKIVCVVGFTENMPSGTAICPGNIIYGRNGKSVEILNTDAEGRLILADLLDLAQDWKPDAIIDAATLTGAVSVALGRQACAILGNDEDLIAQTIDAGKAVGERIWQLPLWDEYFEDMKSECADMRNVANDAQGGTIRGAIFMKQFIKPGMKWAHLDIAGTATDMGHIPYYPRKGAAGIYVRSLVELAKRF
ncbi:MAG: leucyl aminopeptidase [Xanthomonadaceae bacterium]|nr:leucyl aminopeptidase [Xanthomonadaceae bacterium]